jgi:hypothetical protein
VIVVFAAAHSSTSAASASSHCSKLCSAAWSYRDVHRLASVAACVVENCTEPQAGDSPKVSKVPGDQLEIVMNGGGGDLQVGVRQRLSGVLEPSADSTIDLRDLDVVREYGDRRQHAGLDVPEVTRSILRAVRALEELTHDHRARELLGVGDGLKPGDVRAHWTAFQDLGNRVGVEEESHSVDRDRTPRLCASELAQSPDEIL